MEGKLAEALTCPICLEIFEDDRDRGSRTPMLLPCTHNVCRICLLTLVSQHKGNVPCPLCRMLSKAKTIRGFKKNIALCGILRVLAPEQHDNKDIEPDDSRKQE